VVRLGSLWVSSRTTCQRLVPLMVPLTLLKHDLDRYPVPEWVHQQVYLLPYPKELMLRNHA